MKKLFCCLLIALCVAGCGNEKVTDKQVSVIVSNGQTRQGLYTGELNKDGKPEGKGVFKTKNSKGTAYTYTGGFKNGAFDGNAVLVFENGYKEELTYKDGDATGKSKLFKDGKLFYEGDLVKGVRNGKGKAYREDGTVSYEGEYKNGIPNGQGTLYKKDGSVWHQGLFIDGLPAKPPVKLNETVSYADWEFSATGVKTFSTIGNTPASGVFFAVFINAKNNSNFARQIGGDFFVLNDDMGRVFNANTKAMFDYRMASNFNGAWYLSEVNPGLSVQNVTFIFDIPKDAKGLKLIADKGVGKVPPILLQ